MNAQNTPQPLTEKEKEEFAFLKKNLFGSYMFVVMDDETLASPQFKRYDELLKKKMTYLAYVDYLMRNN